MGLRAVLGALAASAFAVAGASVVAQPLEIQDGFLDDKATLQEMSRLSGRDIETFTAQEIKDYRYGQCLYWGDKSKLTGSMKIACESIIEAFELNEQANNLSAGAVDSEIHKLCLEARDYPGCVKAMKGEPTTSPITNRVINQKGADIAEGNSCPHGYAYIGGGNCQEVKCHYDIGRHDPLLGGLKNTWGKDIRSCPKGAPFGLIGGNLYLVEGSLVRASIDPSCPSGEPKLGFHNTCETQGRKNWATEAYDRYVN